MRSSPPCAAVSEALHSRRMRICFLTGSTTILLLYSSELFVSLVHTTIKVDTEFAQIKSGQLIQHNYESCKPATVGLSEIFSTPPPPHSKKKKKNTRNAKKLTKDFDNENSLKIPDKSILNYVVQYIQLFSGGCRIIRFLAANPVIFAHFP